MYRLFVAISKTLYLFFYTLSLWPFSVWFTVWFTFSTEIPITINGIRIIIRGNNLKQKIVDLYMAVSCIAFKQYTPNGFSIGAGDTIVDIGGHIGSFTLFAAALAPAGHVYTFEPNPDSYAALKKNIAANHLENVEIFEEAVSATKGTIAFHQDDRNTAESSMYKTGSRSTTVKSTTLETLFEKNKIVTCDFMKIDCEGAEYDIIFQSPPYLFKRIKKIALECHTPRFFNIANPAYSEASMIEKLQTLGYTVKRQRENALHSLIFAKR